MVDENPITLSIDKGVCYSLFAYDIGHGVNLDAAERHITTSKERSRIKHKHRAPTYFDYRPAPLRVTEDVESLAIGQYRTSTSVDLLVYDFGAVSVTYTIPLEGDFAYLSGLSQELYENKLLLADSRRRVEYLLAAIEGTVERPRISDVVEDYAIFQIGGTTPSCSGDAVLSAWPQRLAQVLRTETQPMAEQEVQDALAHRISYAPDDVTIIDWNAALVFGQDMDDVRHVLEFANVELLEMRFLDQQLDKTLDQAYETLSKRRWARLGLPVTFGTDLGRIGRLQVESAILFERVTNTLKLFGDQYLARVHRLAATRFHLASWDASISRKLQTLESIYAKLGDRAATRRMEVLEWIIIVLIAFSIVVSLLPGLQSH